MGNIKKIAFFTYDTASDISISLWQGVNDESQLNEINLVTFNCGRLASNTIDDLNKMTLFNHFNQKDFDAAIVWGSSLFTFANKDEVKNIYDKYFSEIPCVSIQFNLEKCPGIFYEDYDAMKSMMAHLVNVHKYQKIAFLRGPENHISALNRFQAYKDSLNDFQLPENTKIISNPGDWFNRGKDFIAELIDRRHLFPKRDFEAIMTSNAHMAKECIKELQARGVKVPKDVAVIGFNDDKEARCINPPLTTANPPFYQMGKKAVQMAMQMIRGIKISDKTIMPLDIFIRNSCGCIDHNIIENFTHKKEFKKEISFDKKIQLVDSIIEDYAKAFKTNFDKLKKLFTLIINNLDSTDDHKVYYFMNEYLNSLVSDDEGLNNLYKAITHFQNSIIQHLDEKMVSAFNKHILRLFMFISEIAIRNENKKSFEVDKINTELNNFGISLVENYNIKHLVQILKNDLKKIGIEGITLYLYVNKEKFSEGCKVLINFKDIQNDDGKISRVVGVDKLLNDSILQKESPYSLVASTLYFDKDILGVLVFSATENDTKIFDILRSQLASILKGAVLMEEIEVSKQILIKKSTELERLVRPMLDSIIYITNTSEDKMKVMKKLESVTESGNSKIISTNSIIEKISSHINNMNDMIKVIDEISIAIKLLAINASVASSRSGDFGKVFGVIAKEVRKLSDSTKINAENISRLLNKNIEDIKESTKSSSETYTIFNDIKENLNEVFSYMMNIGHDLIDLKDKSNDILKVMAEKN